MAEQVNAIGSLKAKMQTFKTITKEEQVVDVTTCNNCGRICDRYEPTPIKASGGYDSKHLSDCTTYKFDLCEECLVNIMNGLKIPPTVHDYDGQAEDFDYAKDREYHNNQKINQKESEALRLAAIDSGVCPWTNEGKICGGVPVGSIDGVRSCSICMRDDDHSPVVMVRDEVSTTLEQRKEIGLRYLKNVRSDIAVHATGPHDLSILISTAISMLVTDTLLAAAELRRLTGENPEAQDEWISHRIPMAFGTDVDSITRAKIANDWLSWAQKAGYRNAAASVKLGDTPEQYWNYHCRN